jgi:YspA, cpYpsA-related SLOG family
MRVLVCGSRSWDDFGLILDRLAQLPRGSTVIHGGARGADQMAARVAVRLGLQVEEFIPHWRDVEGHYNRRAGIERNLLMLDQEPELVLAFWDGRSTGTAHTVAEASRRGIPVERIAPAATLPR